MPKSYRFRTEVGVDKQVRLNIDQDFDFLEILSLKFKQEDLYDRFCADYGVVAGRVVVNIPRANTGYTGYDKLIGVVTDGGNEDSVILEGLVKLATNPSGTNGDIIYMSDTAAGQATYIIPSDSGDVVRIIGYVVDASNGVMYFKPSNDYIIIK